jgi:hypothetical protein
MIIVISGGIESNYSRRNGTFCCGGPSGQGVVLIPVIVALIVFVARVPDALKVSRYRNPETSEAPLNDRYGTGGSLLR